MIRTIVSVRFQKRFYYSHLFLLITVFQSCNLLLKINIINIKSSDLKKCQISYFLYDVWWWSKYNLLNQLRKWHYSPLMSKLLHNIPHSNSKRLLFSRSKIWVMCIILNMESISHFYWISVGWHLTIYGGNIIFVFRVAIFLW